MSRTRSAINFSGVSFASTRACVDEIYTPARNALSDCVLMTDVIDCDVLEAKEIWLIIKILDSRIA